MPKRIVDGEGIWKSKKLASVEPVWCRAEYPWILTLAGSNGVFELNTREIWANCYAFGRPDRNLEDVETIIQLFRTAKLLFVWEQDGKQWGYWTGSDKPGRLPRESWRERERKRGQLAPDPDPDKLKEFLFSPSPQPSTAVPCSEHAAPVLGFGIGIGSGIGSGKDISSETDVSDAAPKPPLPAKSGKGKEPPSQDGLHLAAKLKDGILRNNPNAKIPETRCIEWARVCDAMMRLDHRSPEQILEIIEWCQQDTFWHRNILSASTLREKFDRLTLDKKAKTNGANNGHTNRAQQRQNDNLAARQAARAAIMGRG